MAFHPYPQVIPPVFNLGGFGPPRRLTDASTCPWIDHSASGLDRATQRPLRTRFRYGSPTRVNLATQHKLAGSFFKRHAVTLHKEELQRIVGTRFQVLFHSPPGVLFTFPSRYSSAIGHREVFRLDGWSRQIHTEFHEFRATWECAHKTCGLHLRDYHPLRRHFPKASTSPHTPRSRSAAQQRTHPTTPTQQPLPGITLRGFSLLRFRSPLLTESRLFSLPSGTEMFHFPEFPPHTLFHSGAGNWT